ncbi:hypothetical protein GWI33_014838, partial [Rhynchophorus ferrugineus]
MRRQRRISLTPVSQEQKSAIERATLLATTVVNRTNRKSICARAPQHANILINLFHIEPFPEVQPDRNAHNSSVKCELIVEQ